MDMTLWIWIVSGVLALMGIVLCWSGLFRDRARGRRRCPKCWYDMSELDSLQCPECGRTAKAASRLGRTRRHPVPLVVGILTLVLALATASSTGVLLYGWQAAPRPVLVASSLFIEDTTDGRVDLISERLETLTTVERLVLARFCVRMLKEGTQSDAQWALSSLEVLGPSSGYAIPTCRELLETGQFRLQEGAARALCAMRDVESIPEVIAYYEQLDDPLEWIDAIAMTRSAEAVRQYERVLADYPEFDDVLMRVAEAIGVNGHEDGLPVLQRLASREDLDLCHVVVEAMIEIDESDPRAREILMNLLDSGHRRIGLLAYERMSESEREEAKSRIREVALASRDVFVANQLWVLHQVYNDREFIEPWADPASPHLDHLSEDDRNYVVEVVQYMLDHPPPGPDAPG
ncbi:MAG: hypothetical protein KDA28_09645 [Phycisphaerales bacterium]|nr:hypothetical protein [Phycisphaerales bacterium]